MLILFFMIRRSERWKAIRLCLSCAWDGVEGAWCLVFLMRHGHGVVGFKN